MTNFIDPVHKFFESCGRTTTTLEDDDAVMFQLNLIKEEWNEVNVEWNEARWEAILGPHHKVTDKRKAKILKEISDLIWVLTDFCIRFDLPLDKAFEMVAHSNMTKINPETNKPYVTDPKTGKVKKGPHYWEPNIEELFE